MGNRLISIFLGLVSAIAVILFIQNINTKMHPLPQGISPNDTDAIMAAYKNLPTESLLIVLLSFAIGSFTGGFVSSLISKHMKLFNAVVVGVLLLIMGIINLVSIPHPVWFWIVSIIIFIPSSLIGAKLRK